VLAPYEPLTFQLTTVPHKFAVVFPVIVPLLSVRFQVPTFPVIESVQVPVIEAQLACGAGLFVPGGKISVAEKCISWREA